MTLVYRAIWQDDRDHLGQAVQAAFMDWVADRSGGQIVADKPGKYTAMVESYRGQSRIDVRCESVLDEDDDIRIVRNSYVITDNADVRWQTLVRAWTDESGGWCWVDTSVVGESILHARKLDVVAPLVVRNLLDTASNARVGDIAVSTRPRIYSGADAVDELAELVSHFDRSIPVVVFARDDRRFATFGGRATYQDIWDETAKRLAGIAVVAVADENVANELTDMFGTDFGVFHGAFRVYARDVDPAINANAYRHRYVVASRYMGDRNLAAKLAGRIVGPESTLRRPPSKYDAIKADIDRSRDNDTEALFAIVAADYESARQEVVSLRAENYELLEWKEETERLLAQLDYAKTLLITNGVCDDFEDDGSGNFYPKTLRTAEDAVSMAEKYLSSRVEIHPKALREPKMMDRTNEGVDWANIAWNGFKALYHYADFMVDNSTETLDFTTWCESQHNTVGWPADKTARGESGITKDQQKGTRTFPVSKKVSATEEIDMYGHLKIQKKGNSNIPRIYFLYSPRTGKVHVGFYGPHKLVPNTRS